jgi:protocatechuate 3,4-dioxygenase alpha subunit
MSLRATGSQTVGPFFHLGLTSLKKDNLAAPGVAGENVVVQGYIFDGDRKPVADAVIEIWQANSYGQYAHPEDQQGKPIEAEFKGFGRIPTDKDGAFRFTTIKPGRVPGPGDALQAPHLVVTVFARGLLKHLLTRIYFPDEPSNAEDTVLNLVPEDRRATLISQRLSGAENVLEWNIILQGEGETVFFDY